MCIIAVFKRGKRPDKETIQRMMTANRDGVGIAWNTGKHLYYKKGLQTVAEVEKLIEKMRRVGGVKDIIFHARIGTSGGISAEKCHPYPLSADPDTLDRTTYSGGAPVVFHNGVFSIDIEDGLNDSQTFVKNMLYPLYKSDPQGLRRGRYDYLIEMAVSGSRLVIMYPDGFRAFGNGWAEEDEAWYSNTGYKPATSYAYGSRWYDYHDDWYDEDYMDDWEEYRASKSEKSFYIWRREKKMNTAKALTGGSTK
jgi:hypothetical protein